MTVTPFCDCGHAGCAEAIVGLDKTCLNGECRGGIKCKGIL